MILNNVFYLYESEEDAKIGKKFGGTGFLVSVNTELMPAGRACIYAVTNWHVACRDGYSVIRLNTLSGGTDIFPFESHEWDFDPRYDIAVCPLDVDFTKHILAITQIDDAVNSVYMQRYNIGLGDEVFMIGRFVDHDGGQSNRPTARFGHISLMPSPIEQPNGLMADSYCIDVHSRTGYSGSPVFVYRTPTGNLELARDNAGKHPLASLGPAFLGLLGIHWGQFPELWRIQGDHIISEEPADHGTLVLEGHYVKGMSGMTCVLPATCISEVLNMPAVRNKRLEAEREWLKENGGGGAIPVAESAA